MKVYLVGGAVRDKLLGYPVKERDWVVVGATKELLKQKGYRCIGKSFPVFLHPITSEEYALARTEYKYAPGYYGFKCDFNPNISLEEDLKRRDLTINAMAINSDGVLIDPYNGINDLKKKILRHVSSAFIEDPIRVLRIARFKARYHHLGFKIANETKNLMYKIVKLGELKYITIERIWQEWHRSLSEKNPEIFIEVLRSCGALEIIFPEINKLFGVPNISKFHPEIDSGIHALMALRNSVNLTHDPIIRFAVFLCHLEKSFIDMKDWPIHFFYDQDKFNIIYNFCNRLKVPLIYRKLAVMSARFFQSIYIAWNLNPEILIRILEINNAFRNPNLFMKCLLVCKIDFCSCNSHTDNYYIQNNFWKILLEKCASINSKFFIEMGCKKRDIREEMHKKRVKYAKHICIYWKKRIFYEK
ncbi:multifunctional CCA tRNA nucleotidyl transferase/2'3'-cyclic phosphodiesterase/2'nucleotidase/phosphatase [Candidatus Legionella polyplacis]|uniref:multifunctional CCA addition/repair protein n=1 Tax=Candidatus Legionella polyplacis TaxID=2005262 RepID=UPI000C1ECAC6|nr:multifunctional CCA addition/repair protein [Candidatus Legionella polyplacis]ATW01865.1 multifunctional CCA tRNA nucleotidyl transferase/2'3'-cyclic phosphodiesterase/2'nucleotidase/phosphatase [Candidatus Legionella polyplacis]